MPHLVAKMAESYGVITRNSSFAAWVVVLVGGYVMNAGYAIFLLIKNFMEFFFITIF